MIFSIHRRFSRPFPEPVSDTRPENDRRVSVSFYSMCKLGRGSPIFEAEFIKIFSYHLPKRENIGVNILKSPNAVKAVSY